MRKMAFLLAAALAVAGPLSSTSAMAWGHGGWGWHGGGGWGRGPGWGGGWGWRGGGWGPRWGWGLGGFGAGVLAGSALASPYYGYGYRYRYYPPAYAYPAYPAYPVYPAYPYPVYGYPYGYGRW
ncbi:hypothetical protein [Gluconacetobacter asukensis]|uniref:Sulfur globule protein n=1 Tax=Gluconacetobacter asukensis TaxID=1017181 RepID=A0A7W4IY25_9PROT|nr:hypothetical protein [Gluconacetobacter asukensis]MBB2171151.1 hypothetical protein [Gluconacetobacter asukensis]